jgi:CheY-like chemotaxis protein
VAGEPILVIDDNAINLRLVTFLLSSSGYEVREAADAQEALQVLEGFHPRMILMDLHLPRMDGYDLTRRLKSDPATRDIVVIALTASAMAGDEQKALRAGCDGYFTKPIDRRALLAGVTRHLAGGHPGALDETP